MSAEQRGRAEPTVAHDPLLLGVAKCLGVPTAGLESIERSVAMERNTSGSIAQCREGMSFSRTHAILTTTRLTERCAADPRFRQLRQRIGGE